MEKATRFKKKILSIFWVVLYSLPLLFLVLSFFVFYFRSNVTNISFDLVSNYFSEFALTSYFTNIGLLFNDYLGGFLKIFLSLSDTPYQLNNYYLFTLEIIVNWYILVKMVHIIVDMILFLPNLVLKVFEKVGVKDVE